LGLMLVKEFVEKNGGQISVESALNKGTTFTFSVPAAK
jgi:two-component system sensor histidine kinase/response regulator